MPRTRTPDKRTTTERGYGNEHQRLKDKWRPVVDRGDAYCAQPICVMRTRWIPPGTPWALGHTDDRTAYLGPTHARCNQLDGASKGGRTIAARKHGRHRPATWQSRNW
jgi:hypothetical protein